MQFASVLLCSVAVALPLNPAFAQTPEAPTQPTAGEGEETDSAEAEDGATDNEAIVITGARTKLPASALPLTVDVLGGEELDEEVAIAGSVVDAISARMPSFSPTREKLSGSGESLRGRSPLYAINGVPQSTPIRDGSRDGYTIDPFFIDRVEVIYGSNALQGIGATGGVVNQVTLEAPRRDGLSFRTLVQGTAQGGFDGESLGGKLAGAAGWRSGAFDMIGGLSFERRGAFVDGRGNRIGVDGTQGEIQDSDSWSVFGRFGYQLTPSARLELVANRFELEGNGHYLRVPGSRPTGRPASSERGEQAGDLPSNRAELLSLSFTDEALLGGNFTAQAFLSRTRDVFGGLVTDTFQDPAIDPTGNLFDQSANRSRKLGAKLGYERQVPWIEDLTLTAGLDLLFDSTEQFLVQTGRAWVPPTDFRSIAPFLQANLGLFDGLIRLAGGLRHEDVRLKVDDFETLAFYGADDPDDVATYEPNPVAGGSPAFSKLLVNGGVIVEPIEGLRGYASYAQGYTIADVGRILRGITEENVDVDTFLALEPVLSNNREIGLEWTRGAVRASATYFWSDSKLGSRLVRGLDGIFSVVRAPVAIEGLELNAEWRTPLEGLTVGGAYADLEGRTDTDDDGELDADLDGANIAPDRLNLFAEFERGPWQSRLAMRKYLERGFDGEPEANDFEGYTLFDASVGYRLSDAHLIRLSALNITDKFYISYDSDTQAPTDNNRFFAGRGRVITLGLTSSF